MQKVARAPPRKSAAASTRTGIYDNSPGVPISPAPAVRALRAQLSSSLPRKSGEISPRRAAVCVNWKPPVFTRATVNAPARERGGGTNFYNAAVARGPIYRKRPRANVCVCVCTYNRMRTFTAAAAEEIAGRIIRVCRCVYNGAMWQHLGLMHCDLASGISRRVQAAKVYLLLERERGLETRPSGIARCWSRMLIVVLIFPSGAGLLALCPWTSFGSMGALSLRSC